MKTVAQDSAIDKKRAQLASILSGELPITLKSQFLIRKNSSDMLVLKNCKVCTLLIVRCYRIPDVAWKRPEAFFGWLRDIVTGLANN